MEFRYRYVDFGTVFTSQTHLRIEDTADTSSFLYDNELAMDVGGVCWGEDEPRSILDHHFPGSGCSSASATVLENAERIRTKFKPAHHRLIWLVTHQQPDFDAFCSMYLARWILTHRDVDPTESWAKPLASYASAVDNCGRVVCTKSRALHSVLYAALKRGRDYERTGAIEFFDHAREAITKHGLKPLFDSVLENDPEFAPELKLLDNELAAYARDIRRARIAIVHLPQSDPKIANWYDQCKSTPLSPVQLNIEGHTRSQADGIYLRDPECLLFKEWARNDTENSPGHRGFPFTAIAYSNDRPKAQVNHSDYFFSLDPENAGGRHLYTVWARMEMAEIEALHTRHPELQRELEESGAKCRLGYEQRAGAHQALLNDPWFDGGNYKCTIVATPNRGTYIAPAGTRTDLSDDPVANMVREELEYSVFSSPLDGYDLPAIQAGAEMRLGPRAMRDLRLTLPRLGFLRLASVQLHPGVDLAYPAMTHQIGAELWERVLSPGLECTPADFLTRHLIVTPDWLGVWSRRGIVIAYQASSEERVEKLRGEFRELAKLSRHAERFLQKPGEDGELLISEAAKFRRDLAMVDDRLLERFFESTQLSEVLRTIRDVHQTRELTTHTETIADVQTKVEWLEVFFVGFYATELTHILAEALELKGLERLWEVIGVGLAFTGMAFWALLLPWKHAKSKKLVWILVLLALLWVLALIRWYLPH